MDAHRSSVILALVFSAAIPVTAYSTSNLPSVAPFPAVVYLQKDCVATQNCTTTTTELKNWINNTRKPNSSSPLKVDIGPGTFSDGIQLSCNSAQGYTGSVTFEGAGQKQTVIQANHGTMFASDFCTDLEFKHLGLRALTFAGYITWNGGGKSIWNDVGVDAVGQGWQDGGCGDDGAPGSHYWFNSRLSVVGHPQETYLYETGGCNESWFFGSDLLLKADVNSGGARVLRVSNSSIVHVYGSVIRATATASVPELIAVDVSGGEVHIHGTGIDVLSTSSNNLVALRGANHATIHANETAYNMATGSGGTITRIDNNGADHIHAPYSWGEHPTVPFAASGVTYNSATGADTAMVVATPSSHPRLMIYDNNCASKWYDIALGACQ